MFTGSIQVFFILVFLCLISSESYAQKTDTIVVKNGNVITGEVKNMSLGYLTYKTNSLGILSVKWEDVTGIKSKKLFDIRLSDGRRLFVSFTLSKTPGIARAILTNDTVNIPILNITEIQLIQENFWMRLSGNLDLGFNYGKGSQVLQTNTGGKISYRGRKMYSDLQFSSNVTLNNASEINTRKQDVSFGYQPFISNTWYGIASFGAEQNTELGLDLRLFALGGVSNYLMNNSHNRLFASAGLMVTREFSGNVETAKTNLESIIGLRYDGFRRNSPKLDLAVSTYLIPSLTVADRLRYTLDIYGRIEVFNNFYFGLRFYYALDNKPLDQDANKIDWNINSTISYSFN